MMSKGAMGNLINKYRAVLKKCHLLNVFGSLAMAGTLVATGAIAASATEYSARITGEETEYDAIKTGENKTYMYTFSNGDTITVESDYTHGGLNAINMKEIKSITIKNDVNINTIGGKHTTVKAIQFKGNSNITMDNLNLNVISKDSTISNYASASGISMFCVNDNSFKAEKTNIEIEVKNPLKGIYATGIDLTASKNNVVALDDTKIIIKGSSENERFDVTHRGIYATGENNTITTGKLDIDLSGEARANMDAYAVTVEGDGKLSTATLGDGNISAFAKSPNDAFSVGITVHDGAVVSKGDGSITAIAEAGQGTGYGLGIRAKGEGAKLDVGHDDVTVKVTGGLDDGDKFIQSIGAIADSGGSLSLAGGSITASADSEDAFIRGVLSTGGSSMTLGTEEGSLAVKAFGNDSAAALDVRGTSTIALQGNVSVEAPIALYGSGTITNFGNLTVTSGTVADFIGTFTQDDGNTNLSGQDFFGGNVNVFKGALTVGMPDRGGVSLQNNEAMLALGQNVTLGEQAKLVVGDAANSGATVAFGDNSLLVVDGDKAASSFMISAPDAAPRSISVSDGANLYIVNAKIGETYKITDGFVAMDGDVAGWTGDNLVTGRMINAIRSDGTDGKVIVTTELKSASVVFPGVSIPNTIDEIFVSNKNDVDSENPGVAFISRALEPLYLPESDVVTTLDSAAQLSYAGGVQASTIAVAQAPTRAIQDHLSLATNVAQRGTCLHEDGFDLWANALYGANRARDFSAGSLNAGYNSDFAGGVIGSDWTFGAGVGKGRIGLAFNVGTGDTESRGDFNSTKNDFDFWGVSLYGGWSTDNINVVAEFGYSASKNELKQDIPASLGMGGKLKADVDSSVLTTGVKAEYMVKTDVLDVMPHVGVRYMAVKTDSFSTKLDQGGDLFHTDGDLQHVWQFPVGVNLSKSFETESGWKIRPQADLSVVPAAGDTKAKIDVRTPGVDASDSMKRRVMDTTSFDGVFGIEVQKDNISLGLGYNVQASEHQTGQGVTASFMYKF